MPSVGMRRTTRVFGVVKGVDGARVLRSGRRLFPGSGDAKFRRANDGDEWLHTMIKSTTNSNKNNHNNSSVKCKENGWTRHCKLKQETPRLNNGVVPKGVKCESCLPSTTTQTNKFGIVYTRKRRRADGEKLENLDSRKFGIQFSRRQRRRKQFDIHPPRLVVAVDGFCSVGGLTSFLLLVFGYMRKGTLRLSQLASFLSAEPVRNAFASNGIRFLQGSTDGNTRICKIFGVSCTVPIFSLGFSAVPSCFLYMHLRLRFSVKSLSVVPVNTTLDEDSSDESDEEQSISHVKADSLLEISNSENKVVLHPSVRASKLAGRHSQYRNGLNSRGIQKRRSSLRRKKARNLSMIGMHKSNGALVSDLVSSRKNGIPFSSVVSKNKLRSMVQSTAVSNLKMESPAVVEETRAMDTSSCSANVLVIEPDRCYRIKSATVILELSDSKEWMVTVKKEGLTRYTHLAQKGMRPCSFNRVTHDIIWTCDDCWRLEFPNRQDWAIFKDLYKDCLDRNVPAPAPICKAIPVPRVCEVLGYQDSNNIPFSRPDVYISVEEKAKMGYAQLVIGPAGSGKSTYCSSLYQHCETARRTIHIVNLDPAAERFDYPVAMDIRELISLDDVMEELGLGPNGALLYCMEELEDNLDDWLTEELDNYMDDDYLVFDCPGQIELFSHVPVLRNFVEHLQRKNFNVCVVYLLDSQFITDVSKFISGCMASLSALIQLELPHINILSKMDLVPNKKDLEKFLDPDARALLPELNKEMAPQFAKLNKALIELVDQYSMVSFTPLDLRKESSIQYVLSQIDTCIQYGEDADVKVKDFDPEEDDDE